MLLRCYISVLGGICLELTKFGKPTCVEVVFCYQLFLSLFLKINHFSCVYKIKLDLIKKNLIQAVSNQDGKYWVPYSHVHIRTHSLLQTEYPLFKVPETKCFRFWTGTNWLLTENSRDSLGWEPKGNSKFIYTSCVTHTHSLKVILYMFTVPALWPQPTMQEEVWNFLHISAPEVSDFGAI